MGMIILLMGPLIFDASLSVAIIFDFNDADLRVVLRCIGGDAGIQNLGWNPWRFFYEHFGKQ
jgi:hypothetical protein